MNFFERQDRARQQTRRLVMLFGLTVAAMSGGIYLAAVMFLGGGGRCLRAELPNSRTALASGAQLPGSGSGSRSGEFSGQLSRQTSRQLSELATTPAWLEVRRRRSYRSDFGYRRRSSPYVSGARSNCSPAETLLSRIWNPGLFVLVTGGTLAVIAIGSLFKIAQLSAGGRVVAEELGGRLLDPGQASAEERQLLNVVEEMAIAAGMAVPPVYLLDHESGINAFAAGFRPQDAVLGITRGSLEQLSRDQLQGVVGHEFSHILNGDMGLNIRLMGVINGILFIYIAGRMLMYTGSGSDRDGNSLAAFGFALMALGGIGMLGGRLIQSAASRQREFLADASSVQFTRNPDGIAGALEKIGQIGSRLATPQAETASHLFFGNTLNSFWSGDWFATHPPLAERIARIRNVPVETLQPQSGAIQPSYGAEYAAAGFAGSNTVVRPTHPVSPAEPPPSPAAFTPEHVVAQVGTVSPAHYAHARSLLAQLPESLREQVRHPQMAIATLYALFLDPEPGTVQTHQLQALQATEPAAIWELVLAQGAIVQSLEARLRLPLLDLTVPALRQCSPDILERVLASAERLAEADNHWSLSEFLQLLVLERRLEDYLANRSAKNHGSDPVHKSLGPVWSDCLQILSALASAGVKAGSQNPEQVAFTFQNGVQKLPGASPERLPATPPRWTQTGLKESLKRLRNLTPKLQQALITACAHTVLLDNDVTLAEAELLRAITITLDCPIPLFLTTAK
jgi:Zn-dependent protease with chaperone function